MKSGGGNGPMAFAALYVFGSRGPRPWSAYMTARGSRGPSSARFPRWQYPVMRKSVTGQHEVQRTRDAEFVQELNAGNKACLEFGRDRAGQRSRCASSLADVAQVSDRLREDEFAVSHFRRLAHQHGVDGQPAGTAIQANPRR